MPRDLRKLPRAVRALVVGFALSFVVIVVATVVAVRTVEPSVGPDLAVLPLPEGAVALDAEPTCGNGGCDGHGLVVSHPTMDADTLVDQVAGTMEAAGWSDHACDSDACLERGDLRTSIRPWSKAAGAVAPELRKGISRLDADDDRLVYIRFFRCGVFVDCEST